MVVILYSYFSQKSPQHPAEIPEKRISSAFTFFMPGTDDQDGFACSPHQCEGRTSPQHLPDPVCPVGPHGDQRYIILLCNRQDHLRGISHPYVKIHGNTGTSEVLFYVCKPRLGITYSCFNPLV